MLEGIVADVLVRVLGSYVDGLNRESIRVGVWQGDLELHNLRLRPDALAILFETLGLDLPVTVTAGHIGLLRLEVPWKQLRSAPVRIFMRDLTVVASPVSDGDQSALELREQRLKSARLATDEAVRDAKFSVRSELNRSGASQQNSDLYSETDLPSQTTAGNRVTRWGWRFTSRVVTRIVDNIQVDVENVIIQYEDSSSVRDKPYTATLAFDSLRACSTDRQWNRVFIENPNSPIVHKVVYACGLVLNWEPGNSNNELRSWILDSNSVRTPGQWAGLARSQTRHAIRPMDGELRIALTKNAALASAIAGGDASLRELRNLPRVQMDLHFPQVHIALDDFQYHTLLSTIMYLSDIDRKVRPKTARGRWYWALDRLLPRFKERRKAAQQFTAEGLRIRREKREEYCRARNAVVKARRGGLAEPSTEAKIVEELENEFSFSDIMHFRDLADRELFSAQLNESETTSTSSNYRFWSLFSRRAAMDTGSVSNDSSGSETEPTEHVNDTHTSDILPQSQTPLQDSPGLHTADEPESDNRSNQSAQSSESSSNVPKFRMGFLLGRGAIELKEGGFNTSPTPISSLEFRELRLGIATRPTAGFLLEALLGTFEVVDLQKDLKVMYPRAPWAGEKVNEWNDLDDHDDPESKTHAAMNTSMSQLADEWLQEKQLGNNSDPHLSDDADENNASSIAPILQSYPHHISDAIAEIRGEYGVESTALPLTSPRFSPYRSSVASESSSSVSGLSDCGTSAASPFTREDLSTANSAPLRYIAALRLNQEEATGEWASGATRMAMDLAIGGMEVLIDGANSAFISSVTFWHPREKMPSIMQFLMRAAAPRLASLRMNIQKALLERSVPMRMDLLIRGPRFVIPGSVEHESSLVLDLGTFAMETSTSAPEKVSHEDLVQQSMHSDSDSIVSEIEKEPLTIRYTEYKMAFTDLGVYVVSEAGRHAAERIVRPFSVHLLLEVLHNSSFIEAMTLSYKKVDISRVKLRGKLPSLRTSVSHHAFRQILEAIKTWEQRSNNVQKASGIEPNPVAHSLTMSAELEKVRQSHDPSIKQPSAPTSSLDHFSSPLISFQMMLDFEDLQLELRDSMARRIVTISSSGTQVLLTRRPETIDFDYRVRSFTVTDGSRGATAPFRRLVYAGTNSSNSTNHDRVVDHVTDHTANNRDSRAFIKLSYHGDLVNHEQMLGLKILSLNLVCVRESYFALADFFYLKDRRKAPGASKEITAEQSESIEGIEASPDDDGAEYADPFAAVGMTTSRAAQVLRQQAGRGMQISKQAIANRGRISVKADLDGLNITLVTAEGAIASFDVTDCKTHLIQDSNGSINASGDLGGFGVCDLTSAYDVYSETIRYNRTTQGENANVKNANDGWKLKVPSAGAGDIELHAYLRNIRIVYLHRFIIILKKYFDVLRQSLKPILEMKGGLGEVFDSEHGEDFPSIPKLKNRVNLSIVTECIDIVMPRHSQSPYEALRFFVPHSSINNVDIAAPGYQIGLQVKADGVDTYVLYQKPAEGEGRALTKGGKEPVLKHITPNTPVENLTPFSTDISLIAKLDMWRRRRVPEVVLNADGLPVLKDGEEEREYDPAKWLPALRVRVSAPKGISARLCEAEYSILYFTFTENVIERPDIEFTDIVRGLKTPVLPARRPVQPIMFSSNKMPPNYQIIFEVPRIDSVIMSGADPKEDSAALISTKLTDLLGSFDYGVDYRMTIEVNANLRSLVDIRPGFPSHGKTLITKSTSVDDSSGTHDPSKRTGMSRSVTFTWDRPFGFRSNIMIVASDMKIIVEPELFRDLGALTTPGFPFLKSSAPPPLLRFNGRLMIVTVSRPEIWVMANQFPGDGRSLVLRGDIIAKVQWAAVTGRQMVEVAANGIHMNLSNVGPSFGLASNSQSSPRAAEKQKSTFSLPRTRNDTETPMLYPCDISLRYDGSGYDPPENADGEPVKISGSSLSINAESFLVRVDVNDTPLILAVGSRLVRLKSSELSRRPVQPGRFDQWIDKGEDGDAKLAVDFSLPNSRLMFTDETAGRYVPIMEARIRNAVVKSNVPWLTNLSLEFGLDLFNDEKGWWEPGIEMFPVQLAASQGRSGSRAIHIRAEKNIDINVTPNTVSGAARVSKALKSAIVDLTTRLRQENKGLNASNTIYNSLASSPIDIQTSLDAKRPSVAAFCVRNETGRSMFLWLPYDSKRRPLHGSGGEIEVDTPSEELLWTAIGADALSSTNPNKNRQVSLSCILCLSGYVPKTFSTAQTGTWLVTMKPDMREIGNVMNDDQPDATALTVVWSVAMRDGVPCGCIRSVLRIVNCTRTVLEVSVGGLRRSASAGSALKYGASDLSEEPKYESEVQREHEPHGLVKAGESWSIPIYAIHRAIRIRPAIFHAPEVDLGANSESMDSQARSRVFYTYKWSDPLSKISALHQIGYELIRDAKNTDTSTSRNSGSSPSGPALTCRADDRKHVFTMTLHPKIDVGMDALKINNTDVPGWVDVHICAPLVIENLLPRPLFFKLGLPGNAKRVRQEQVLAEYYVEPLRETHIHTVGSNLTNVAIAISVDNNSVQASPSEGSRLTLARNIGDFLPNLPSLNNISMGSGRYSPFILKFDHEKTVSSRTVRAYCEFWIRNRSDTDLFFRDRDNSREAKEYSSPKVFLRGRPPGTKADKFICFSGKWLLFQRADATEDVWVSIPTEVSEIDKPIHIKFDSLSLLLEVRPAKGRLQRSLVATIRNAVWLENRTGTMLQWCQPAALNAHGIALTSRVHIVKPGEVTALHWDFSSRRKAICLRRANEDGSSEWIWSRPVNVQGAEGEFVAKMYRPKRHEQYIARVMISMLKYGVRGVVVHREDRNTPPYRIVNNCTARSIAFRQSGVHETHPWLVRPGNSTRYSWDDPQAPVKKRSLVVEVIEVLAKGSKNSTHTVTEMLDTSGSPSEPNHGKTKKEKEIRYPKFDLNIDLITSHVPFAHSNRFNPPLIVSVHVDGPTKVVTFGDGVLGEISPRPSAGRSKHIADEGPSSSEVHLKERYTRSLDVELFINAIGVSFVESSPTELAYLSITGVHFRLDRFDGQQLVICEIQDLQLDNQVPKCPWPVVLWSPPPFESGSGASSSEARKPMPKPFFQLTIDGPYPSISQGIGNFRGIFVALQELQIAADEDFVLRVWLFVVSLIEAAGGSHEDKEECLTGKDGFETELRLSPNDDADSSDVDSVTSSESRSNRSLKRLYIEHLELCPLKLTVSFTSSRTSNAAERIGGFRSLMRTLVAVLGNVENAEFRFNALELQHMFDSVSHFRSLITEFYVTQGSNQKMVLLASNSLIGNPSALFDSIAIGTRDFFVEPANAKGSADFIASIGRGSSSLLTNTVGGLVGSIGAIPKAMAQGLETAVGDRDYLAERDSIRGGRARIVSSPAQGLVTGALSFGHGIASAAAGLIRDPIQGAAEEGASGFIKGLGKGFIGGVLKPITGALDLIAEPAAGFRSMMVSDRNREFAEPVRPSRAFWGAHGDQMTSYDLRAALGQSILEAVNGSESSADGERIVSWTHLVAVHHNASDEQVIGFLWALMRRSTRSTAQFQAKYLLDAQGNPQRAEKMRAGLITTKRLIITSLEGHVLWDYPLVDIVDSHVSLEAKDYLMVGVRPVGYSSRLAIAPNWKKIHCGSMTARNEMNNSLRKAIQERRIATETLMGANALFPPVVNRTGNGRGLGHDNVRKDRRVLGSRIDDHTDATDANLVEMVDLSNAGGMNESDGDGVELKSFNHDASVDGKRGVFTNMKLPGRELTKDGKPILTVPAEANGNMYSCSDKQKVVNGLKKKQASQEVQKALDEAALVRQGQKYRLGLRSICIFVLNELDVNVIIKRAHMESGRWSCELPRMIPPHSFVKLESDSEDDRVKDILGWIELTRESHEGYDDEHPTSSISDNSNDVCTARFLNPMLAANAYAVNNASWMIGTFKGGEKGDHVMTTLKLCKVDEAKSTRDAAARADMVANEKRKKSTVEPLLFGRSKVAPLPLTKIEPPHAPKKQPDPEDPELIAKLSSLGFTEEDARYALKESHADLSIAYAKLVENKSGNEDR